MNANKLFCLTIITLVAFIGQVEAQSYNLPLNPGAGKCYERCFDYDKKIEWKEIDCSKRQTLKNKTEEELIACEQAKIKMEKYQEKLQNLGYNVDITGIPDSKTTIAHHKYLKKKLKEERRKKRREKKAERKHRK